MNPLKTEARAWLQRALVSSFAGSDEYDAPALEAYGDGLWAIAEAQNIPDEARIRWIHDKPSNKDWSLTAWRVWCAKYAAVRAQLPPEVAQAPEPPLAPETKGSGDAAHLVTTLPERILCPRCYASEAQRHADRWFCGNCGEVS